MIPRYQGEFATIVFDDQYKLQLWQRFTMEAMVRIAPDHLQLAMQAYDWCPTPEAVATREHVTRHDVVAFLFLLEDQMPVEWHRYFHYGMTSSDLVENAHFRQLREHLVYMRTKWSNFHHIVGQTIPRTDDGKVKIVSRPGRTHGQLAEPTSWNHQMNVWSRGSYNIMEDAGIVTRDLMIAKTVGPVGASGLRSDHPDFAVPSTQVIPRDYQLSWATIYLRLACQMENLALLVRTGSRAEIAEVREGRLVTQVGSSAMPHKRNPIFSEKVCGLARVARGLFSAIAESTGALWDDRDISNSSVERTAVVDLAHVVEHMVDTMAEVMARLELDEDRMIQNSKDPACWTSTIQGLLQKHAGIGPVAAGAVVRELLGEGDPEWLVVRAYEWFNTNNKVYAGGEFMQDYAKVWDSAFHPDEPTNPADLVPPF